MRYIFRKCQISALGFIAPNRTNDDRWWYCDKIVGTHTHTSRTVKSDNFIDLSHWMTPATSVISFSKEERERERESERMEQNSVNEPFGWGLNVLSPHLYQDEQQHQNLREWTQKHIYNTVSLELTGIECSLWIECDWSNVRVPFTELVKSSWELQTYILPKWIFFSWVWFID